MSAAVIQKVNEQVSQLRNRYAGMLARGLDAPALGYTASLDEANMRLKSIEGAVWAYTQGDKQGQDLSRLQDIVVNEGLKIKAILDRVNSKYPTQRGFETGGSIDVFDRMPESSIPAISVADLEDSAPVGIAAQKGGELAEGVPWYFWQGIDLRWVGGALALAVVAAFVWRR